MSSNVSFNQVTGILASWSGTPSEKWEQWHTTYNFVLPPPPPESLLSEALLAAYIEAHYTGKTITEGT